MKAKSRHEPGVRCVYCNRPQQQYSWRIRGTQFVLVCDQCAEKHAQYVEPLEKAEEVSSGRDR